MRKLHAVRLGGRKLSVRGALAVFALVALAVLFPGLSSGGSLGVEQAAAKTCPGKRANPGNVKPARASRAVLCLVNRRRASNNLPRVKMRKPLRAGAKRHSRRIVRTGCFGHTCGGSMLRRVQRTNYLPCNCSYRLGETLAWGAGRSGKPRRIVRSWMRSFGHRAILMDRGFRHIGVGVARGAPGRGGSSNAWTFTAILGAKR